jgi:hypothetical protein
MSLWVSMIGSRPAAVVSALISAGRRYFAGLRELVARRVRPRARHNSRHNLSETGGYEDIQKPSKQAGSALSGPPYYELITRRSRVRIPPPLLRKALEIRGFL